MAARLRRGVGTLALVALGALVAPWIGACGQEETSALVLPERYAYPVPLAGEWVDPSTGKVLGALPEGLPLAEIALVDSLKGIYRVGNVEIDARTRETRTVDAVVPSYEPVEPKRGEVRIGGTVGKIVANGDACALRLETSGPAQRVEVPLPAVATDIETRGPSCWEWGLEERGGYFNAYSPSLSDASVLVEPSGRIAYRCAGEFVLDALRQDDGLVVLTTKAVRRIASDATVRWEFEHRFWSANNGTLVALEGGGILVFVYSGGRANLGARAEGPLLVRLRASDGRLGWRKLTIEHADFMVGHSFYVKHARLEVRGRFAIVADSEWAGTWLEIVDIADGRTLRQWTISRPSLLTPPK